MSKIPQPSQRAQAKKRWQRAEDIGHQAVLSRVAKNGRRCEARSCDLPAQEDAHLFGRGRGAFSAPWCHASELRAGLCRGHHESIDRNIDIETRDLLRLEALIAFAVYEKLDAAPPDEDVDPLGAARVLDTLMHEKYPDPTDWTPR